MHREGRRRGRRQGGRDGGADERHRFMAFALSKDEYRKGDRTAVANMGAPRCAAAPIVREGFFVGVGCVVESKVLLEASVGNKVEV